jgi:hypothetical protein
LPTIERPSRIDKRCAERIDVDQPAADAEDPAGKP